MTRANVKLNLKRGCTPTLHLRVLVSERNYLALFCTSLPNFIEWHYVFMVRVDVEKSFLSNIMSAFVYTSHHGFIVCKTRKLMNNSIFYVLQRPDYT